jgi:hypothetical protein
LLAFPCRFLACASGFYRATLRVANHASVVRASRFKSPNMVEAVRIASKTGRMATAQVFYDQQKIAKRSAFQVAWRCGGQNVKCAAGTNATPSAATFRVLRRVSQERRPLMRTPIPTLHLVAFLGLLASPINTGGLPNAQAQQPPVEQPSHAKGKGPFALFAASFSARAGLSLDHQLWWPLRMSGTLRDRFRFEQPFFQYHWPYSAWPKELMRRKKPRKKHHFTLL